MEKDFKGPGGRENIKNYGQQVMPVRTREGFRAQEHMAGRGREKPLWCQTPHHPGWERSVHWEG